MPLNAVKREIPQSLPGFDVIKPFEGAFENTPLVRKEKGIRNVPKLNKLVETVEQAVLKTELKDGMTISFHHHFRNGDYILNMVLDVIANLGIKNLTLASSSLTDAHSPLVGHIKNGVVTQIYTSGLRGELGEFISNGGMENPVLIHSHGGRARAIETRKISIDVAFLGVPSSDVYGNSNGYTGKSACGSLGYAKVDAEWAKKVVLITDFLVEYPNTPFSIHQDQVDYIVKVDSVGDPNGISTGATRMTKNPRDLLIARNAADVIVSSGYFEDGFSIQTGSGGASLATTKYLRDYMIERNVKASWGLGGITSQMVKLHEEGLITKLLDTQSFDLDAVKSIANNRYHTEISASYYANPLNKGCAVNKLNVVILSALEIDVNFNVNVLTGSDGVLRGASGGHSDTAVGSGLSIIVAPLIRGRTATVVDNVQTIITPGETVDVLVTDRGIAVNPRRQDVLKRLRETTLPLYTIEELRDKAQRVAGTPEKIEFEEKVVALVEYRDGTIIDVVHQVKS
ncbi:citrate lyase subunit alpha [Spirochaeta isovalerica]|uniref:Citrate lyase alpha chain n=1 Tax=Spirochaeta isovalerica TaxID=150 RepID=A0A841R8H9_9SPIO|nr:citrate lyase subunit alpha [Spirochaeta isovalerica]MBB6480205.1 citrate lyase subunit alpha/citrate CoA-transferase [Spirochaeta isovalerica]